jgi:Domain of unknown function (DU1801)
MAKYVNKTQPLEISPIEFIKNHETPSLIEDSLKLVEFFERVTGYKAVIWGKMVGFGKYHYTTKACDADYFITGFAPRKSEITIYSMCGYSYDKMPELMDKLGKFKAKGSCLHIKKLSDIDLKILEQIIIKSVEYMKANYKVY